MRKFILILIILLFLIYLPVIVIAISAFGTGDSLIFPPDHFGIEYFVGLFSNGQWLNSFFTSIKISLLAVVISVPVGLSILSFQRIKINLNSKISNLIYILTNLPFAIPPILLGIGFFVITRKLNVDGNWLILGIINSILGIPVVMIICGIALKRFPEELVDAASTCGANSNSIYKTVIIPYILPSILLSSIIIFMLTFEELVIALYVSNAQTIPISVRFWTSIKYNITPYVSSATLIMLLLALLILLVINVYKRKH